MQGKFPAGPLLVLCYIGAFSSFLAIVYMLIGKSVLFSPGRQMVLSWMFLGVELAMVAMNIILVFQGTQDAQGFMAFWLQVAPATPVLNMGIVAILYFLDEDQARRHSDLELQNQIDNYDRKYVRELHKSRTKLKMRQLDYVTKALEQAVNSQESLDYIAQFGSDMNVQLLQNLTGKPAPQQRRVIGPVVEADGPKQLPAPARAGQTQPSAQPVPVQRDSLVERMKRAAGELVGSAQSPQKPIQALEERPQPVQSVEEVSVQPVQPVEKQIEAIPTPQAQTRPVRGFQPVVVDRRRQLIEARRRRRSNTRGFQVQVMEEEPTMSPVVEPVQEPEPVQPVQEEGNGGPKAGNVEKPKTTRRRRSRTADASTTMKQ
jgi:NADH:ubiquinone oxidoreductase subunit K